MIRFDILQKMEMCRMTDSLREVREGRGACDRVALAYILLHRSSSLLLACTRSLGPMRKTAILDSELKIPTSPQGLRQILTYLRDTRRTETGGGLN